MGHSGLDLLTLSSSHFDHCGHFSRVTLRSTDPVERRGSIFAAERSCGGGISGIDSIQIDNLKAAKGLNLTAPQSLLAIADEVLTTANKRKWRKNMLMKFAPALLAIALSAGSVHVAAPSTAVRNMNRC